MLLEQNVVINCALLLNCVLSQSKVFIVKLLRGSVAELPRVCVKCGSFFQLLCLVLIRRGCLGNSRGNGSGVVRLISTR